eukprot:g11970.t1
MAPETAQARCSLEVSSCTGVEMPDPDHQYWEGMECPYVKSFESWGPRGICTGGQLGAPEAIGKGSGYYRMKCLGCGMSYVVREDQIVSKQAL